MQRVFLIVALAAYASGYTPVQTASPDERIVGGNETIIERFPFIVSLQNIITGHRCGGSIVTATAVVTAAHCVASSLTFLLVVKAGSTSKSSGGTTHWLSRVLIHPNYNSETSDFDVAILFVSSPFTFNEKVQPIDLAAANFPLSAGTKVNATGWGVTSSGGSSPTNLRTVELEIVDTSSCADSYAPNEITERMVCAASPGKDSCQGDSGGPLSIDNTLVGIVSWGKGCALAGFPGVYANVLTLSNWILSNLGAY